MSAPVIFLYLLSCSFLYVSGTQLRLGFPSIPRERLLTSSGSWPSHLVFKWLYFIPYIWEITSATHSALPTPSVHLPLGALLIWCTMRGTGDHLSVTVCYWRRRSPLSSTGPSPPPRSTSSRTCSSKTSTSASDPHTALSHVLLAPYPRRTILIPSTACAAQVGLCLTRTALYFRRKNKGKLHPWYMHSYAHIHTHRQT